METLHETGKAVDTRNGQLKAILYLLQTSLEEFKVEVDSSYELLKVDVKTPLLKKIENTLDDPLRNLFELSSDIDVQVKYVVDRIVKSFFAKNTHLIDGAYRTKTDFESLHYSIVLKEDNMESRMEIFEFLDRFEGLEISNKYPIDFQFVPKSLISKIYTSECINLESNKA